MLSKLLINYDFWFSIALLIFIGIMFYLICRYETGRWILGTIFMLVLLGSSIYCGIQMYGYYNVSGAIHGLLYGNTNTTVYVKNFEYDFKFIELRLNQNNEYVAEVEVSDVCKLDSSNNYVVLVNDVPIDVKDYGKDYLIAHFTHNFYNTDKEVVMIDTIILRFAFHENKTIITLVSKGNATAIRYWYKYFSNNGFVVTIEKNNKAYKSNNTIDIVLEDEVEGNSSVVS